MTLIGTSRMHRTSARTSDPHQGQYRTGVVLMTAPKAGGFERFVGRTWRVNSGPATIARGSDSGSVGIPRWTRTLGGSSAQRSGRPLTGSLPERSRAHRAAGTTRPLRSPLWFHPFTRIAPLGWRVRRRIPLPPPKCRGCRESGLAIAAFPSAWVQDGWSFRADCEPADEGPRIDARRAARRGQCEMPR